MNNLHYDFENTGYKLHLPVVPDTNDPLTKKIAAYLDNLYGTTEADRFGFKNMGGGNKVVTVNISKSGIVLMHWKTEKALRYMANNLRQ